MKNDNKIIFDQVKEYFKDAVEVVSLLGTQFLIKDCNFNKLSIYEDSVFVERSEGNYDVSLYNLDTKQYAKIVITKQKLKASFNPSKNWLEDAIWSGGSSVTPEILLELTEPKNEAKRLKVGGIYKHKQTKKLLSSLIKITKDDGIEIWGYGFLNGKYFKNQLCYGKDCRKKVIERQIKVTQEKWEKALLKYKK